MDSKKMFRLYTFVGLMLCGLAIAGNESASPMNKDQRERLALTHERMAACIRSDKALGDCHREIMKTADPAMKNMMGNCSGMMNGNKGGMSGMNGMMGSGNMGMMGKDTPTH